MHRAQLIQKEFVKQQLLKQLKDDDLQVISFTDNSQKIIWEDNHKEFYFNNEMFDVVKSKIVKGKIVLYCVNDKIEKALIDKYNLITKHNSSDGKTLKILLEPIDLFLYESVNTVFQYKIISSLCSHHNSSLAAGIHASVSPPPKA